MIKPKAKIAAPALHQTNPATNDERDRPMHHTSKKLVPKNLDLADELRVARPSLIFRVNSENDGTFEATPSIRKVEYDFEEVLDEGYDPSHSPLGCPVYWRIVRRGDEKFYYSTFQVPRDYVLKVWGAKGLSYCDPVTGRAVARIETRLWDDETLSNGVRRDEIGHTPLQYEIIGEGFSLRELMQAL